MRITFLFQTYFDCIELASSQLVVCCKRDSYCRQFRLLLAYVPMKLST